MSDTPRTDAEVNAICKSGIDWHYSAVRVASFARQLERELAEAKELLDDDRRFEDSESERDAERERAKGDIALDIQDADL